MNQETLYQATEGIAFAAQALGSPLEATAETVGKVINQFGLLKTETSFVGDVLVTAINESALSFDSFGTAIQYVVTYSKKPWIKLSTNSRGNGRTCR